LFHREEKPESADQPQQPSSPTESSSSSSSSAGEATPDTPIPPIAQAERNAVVPASWDLDLHIAPVAAGITARGVVTVRNTSAEPVNHVALELSSSLRFESLSVQEGSSLKKLSFGQHIIPAAVDHTGRVTEAVATLPFPLAAGKSVTIAVLYNGTINPSTARLEAIGAPAEQAESANWDGITPTLTALRGRGSVLWYPSPPSNLSPGMVRLEQSKATLKLRLAVEYVGEPPAAAYLNGSRAVLQSVSENDSVATAEAPGIAVTQFPARPIGFRTPSLFVVSHYPTATDNMLISAVTQHPEVLPSYNAASNLVKPLLSDWLGANPIEPLTILDHPGQPYEDNAFIVAPLAPNDAALIAPAMAHSLAHAWFRSNLPWLNEGVPHFLDLLWLEQAHGRDAALGMLRDQLNTLAMAEPKAASQGDAAKDAAGQPLIRAHDEIYYSAKAGAVLWMLRSVVGDAALKHGLTEYRSQRLHDLNAPEDPHEFQHVLERTSNKPLGWIFDDWVYKDSGLPDLSIVSITPRSMEAHNGRGAGWLVAVEIRNDGDPAVLVPVTVRSGTLTKTEMIHLPGHTSMTTRILFEGTPTEVILNDGNVPELVASSHVKKVDLPVATGF
jgi:hypothetical protein